MHFRECDVVSSRRDERVRDQSLIDAVLQFLPFFPRADLYAAKRIFTFSSKYKTIIAFIVGCRC